MSGHGQRESSDSEERDEHTLDRELDELTSELRMIIPGVTVIWAFLLTVPVASGFPSLSVVQRGAYFVAFLSSTVALIFLLGESAYHQLCGKPYDKARMLDTANRQVATGLVLLTVSLTSVVLLVSDILYGPRMSVPLTIGVLVLTVTIWFVLPLSRRRTRS